MRWYWLHRQDKTDLTIRNHSTSRIPWHYNYQSILQNCLASKHIVLSKKCSNQIHNCYAIFSILFVDVFMRSLWFLCDHFKIWSIWLICHRRFYSSIPHIKVRVWSSKGNKEDRVFWDVTNVSLGEWFLMFQRNMVFPLSRFRHSKNSHHGNSSLGCPTFENEGNAFLQKSRNHLPNDIVSHLWRTETSITALWDPKSSYRKAGVHKFSKNLSTTIQTSIVQVIKCPEFVHTCNTGSVCIISVYSPLFCPLLC